MKAAGLGVGGIDTGDWLGYTVEAEHGGTSMVSPRVASPAGSTGRSGVIARSS